MLKSHIFSKFKFSELQGPKILLLIQFIVPMSTTERINGSPYAHFFQGENFKKQAKNHEILTFKKLRSKISKCHNLTSKNAISTPKHFKKIIQEHLRRI